MIYFISDGEFIKVGVARSFKARFGTHQTSNARKLTVLTKSAGDEALERRLHKVLPGKVRKGSEWYSTSDEILKLCDRIVSAGFDDGASIIEEFIASKNRPCRDWGDFDAAFKGAVAAVIELACFNHGVNGVARVMGVTPASVRLYRNRCVVPSAGGIAALGRIEPQLVGVLFGDGEPVLSALAAFITTTERERLRAVA